MSEDKIKRTAKPIIRKGLRFMLIVFSILFISLLIPLVALILLSPGKTKPLTDESGIVLPGSISEKIFVNINGIQQGMFIKSKDSLHPVLLYLHGGMPEYFLSQKYPTGLEDYFTVVWWEQRGSGLSFSSDIPQKDITSEQMISDTKEVSNYLRKRFGKEKIFLMGHSGGTFIGIQVAARYPELYHAYVGVAQMTNQLESERMAHEYMYNQYTDNGNTRMARRLKESPVTTTNGTPDGYLTIRDKAMHSLGIGTMRNMHSVITGIFFPSLACRDYTLKEKFNLWSGKSQSGVSLLWPTILKTDMNQLVPKLDIPVYFFHGIHDYTVSYTLARDYFEKLEAPIKGFYSFDQSAHSPMFEEPAKMQRILEKDVLKGMNSLANLK